MVCAAIISGPSDTVQNTKYIAIYFNILLIQYTGGDDGRLAVRMLYSTGGALQIALTDLHVLTACIRSAYGNIEQDGRTGDGLTRVRIHPN